MFNTGGLGASTILGAINNKLVPAALLWIPTGSEIPASKDEGSNAEDAPTDTAPDAGTVPEREGGNAPVEQGEWSPTGNEDNVQTLIFHCVETEAMEASCQVTNFPVSTGFNVSDHVFRNNPVINMSGIVSNVEQLPGDFTSLPSILKVSGAILKSPLGGLAANAVQFGKAISKENKSPSNVETFHTKLEELCLTGQLVQVVTLRGVYPDCVITKYSTSANADTSSTLSFTISLERLNVVSTKYADGTPAVGQTAVLPTTKLGTVGEDKVKKYDAAIGIGSIGL